MNDWCFLSFVHLFVCSPDISQALQGAWSVLGSGGSSTCATPGVGQTRAEQGMAMWSGVLRGDTSHKPLQEMTNGGCLVHESFGYPVSFFTTPEECGARHRSPGHPGDAAEGTG